MKRSTQTLCTIALLALAAPLSGAAQQPQEPLQEPEALVGILTVFDPENLAEGIKRLRELRTQVSELRRQLDQMRDTHNLLVLQWSRYFWQTEPLRELERYRIAVEPWGRSQASDFAGRTRQWISSINSGRGAASGYEQATVELERPGGLIEQFPGAQQERLRVRYAAVELADAANRHGMETLGGVRRHGRESRQALEELEEDTYSDGFLENQQVAVLSKISAASMAELRSRQETNKLLSSLLEQQLVEARARRDAQAEEINRTLAFQREARAAAEPGLRGSASVLASFRLP